MYTLIAYKPDSGSYNENCVHSSDFEIRYNLNADNVTIIATHLFSKSLDYDEDGYRITILEHSAEKTIPIIEDLEYSTSVPLKFIDNVIVKSIFSKTQTLIQARRERMDKEKAERELKLKMEIEASERRMLETLQAKYNKKTESS
jgi:hypothetical protein